MTPEKFPKAVASILHNTEVDVEIFKRKGEDNTDHFQFAITEKREEIPRNLGEIREAESEEGRRIERQSTNPFLPSFEQELEDVPKNIPKNIPTEEKQGQRSEQCGRLKREESIGSKTLSWDQGSLQSDLCMMSMMEKRISPQTFCHCFPFHLIFDRNLNVRQAGTSVCRVLPALTKPDTLITDVFETVRPHMELTVKNILSHINTVFVLRTKTEKPTSGGENVAPVTVTSGGKSTRHKIQSTDSPLLDPALNPAKPPEHSK